MPYINELKNDMDSLIHKKQENCDKGGTQAIGIFDYVRKGIQDLINLAQAKKDNVVQRLKKEIPEKIVSPFEEIESTEHKIHKVRADIYDYYNAASNYADKALKTDDYTLFNNYYDGYQKKRKKNKKEEEKDKREKNFPYYNDIHKTAVRESQIIIHRKRKGFIISLLITIACIVLDSFMLYAPFSIGNIGGPLYSVFLGVMFALVLDALPTGMGIIDAEITNIEKMIELKMNAKKNITSDEKTLRKLNIAFRSMGALTAFFFILYLAARGAMFLGGGDFNVGIQIFLAEGSIIEKLREIEFQFSDISGFIPAGSSFLAYFLSRMFTVTDSMCVDAFNIKMRDVLQDISIQCNNQRYNLICQKDALIDQKNNQMAQLWALYGNIAIAIPHNFANFMMIVTTAAQIQAITTYSGTYEAFCREARSHTEIEINTLKEKLSCYSDKPIDVIRMPVSDEEKAGLNYIWNMNGEQHQQTQSHIEDLTSYIENMLSKWRSPDKNPPGENENKSDNHDFDFDTNDLNFQ